MWGTLEAVAELGEAVELQQAAVAEVFEQVGARSC